LRGIRAFVNHDRTKTWPITANDDKLLRLDVSSQPVIAQVGQSLRGLYKFDTLKLRNAKLDSIDVVDVTAPVDKDAASAILGSNLAPPVLNPSLISLVTTPTGSAVIGTAGAVSDLDVPIAVFATNTATGNIYQATVLADGSFSIGVQGSSGNPIT